MRAQERFQVRAVAFPVCVKTIRVARAGHEPTLFLARLCVIALLHHRGGDQLVRVAMDEEHRHMRAIGQSLCRAHAAEKHAAHLNKYFEYDEYEPVFVVWEEAVLSEFNP